MARFVCAIVLAAFFEGAASPAFACPFCESTTADQVRAGIFNSDFVYHLGVSFAPFPILIAILILIYYWPTGRAARTEIQRLHREDPLHSTSEHV
jgi:hypothetical protein